MIRILTGDCREMLKSLNDAEHPLCRDLTAVLRTEGLRRQTVNSAWSQRLPNTSPTWSPCSARSGGYSARTARSGSTSVRLTLAQAMDRMTTDPRVRASVRTIRSIAGRSPASLVVAVPSSLAGSSVLLHMATMAQYRQVRRVLISLIPISVMDVELLCRSAVLTCANLLS